MRLAFRTRVFGEQPKGYSTVMCSRWWACDGIYDDGKQVGDDGDDDDNDVKYQQKLLHQQYIIA